MEAMESETERRIKDGELVTISTADMRLFQRLKLEDVERRTTGAITPDETRMVMQSRGTNVVPDIGEPTIPSESRILTEEESYCIEFALDSGFRMIDDDAEIFIVRDHQIVDLLRRYIPREQRALAQSKRINNWIEETAKSLASRYSTPLLIADAHDQIKAAIEEAALRIINDPVTLLNNLSVDCHAASVRAGWWNDLATGEDLHGKRNIGELLLLVITEITEAFEGERKDKMDDHLPHRKAIEVELADALIRIFDFAGAKGLDIGGAYLEKRAYNDNRADHKPENRRKADGKKF